MDFKPFGRAVNERFNLLSREELYVCGVGDHVWDVYQNAFPSGTNPIFNVRKEHDCSCCKHFLRNVGNVVAIINGEIHTIWEIDGLEYPYDVVAKELDSFVRSQPIVGIFRSGETRYGIDVNYLRRVSSDVVPFHHFFCTVDKKHFTKAAGTVRGDAKTSADVLRRALEELSVESLGTVIELITSNSLYRGEEHLKSVNGFYRLSTAYRALSTDSAKDLFVWKECHNGLAHFKNSVIGTLVTDLSSGVDLEAAVRLFESKVAPLNYKRSTALITPRMITDAMKTIQELDIEPALERRFAHIGDVTINNVLWADGSIKPIMKDGIEGMLMEAVLPSAVKADGDAENISIEDFMNNVLPKAREIGMYVGNPHTNNLMSITAPVHPGAKHLFKWENGFAWSYSGNVTDSITERVKRAGGNIDAKLRFSLSWFNYDDLDIHVIEPDGNHIYFSNRCLKLDVDMNAGGGTSREPVENVALKTPTNGEYRVYIHQYNKRENVDVGFVVEVANENNITQYSYPRALWDNERVDVGKFVVQNGDIISFEINPQLNGKGISKNVWGLGTEQFVPVDTVMYSPNHWDEQHSGNRHWFFILRGCKNDIPCRGIYNEFLCNDLEKHRKVFEILGEKTKCPVVPDQLSGLGFSSTKKDSVLVRVKGEKMQRLLKINF